MKTCPEHGKELVRTSLADSRGKVTIFLRCPVPTCFTVKPIKNPNGEGRNANRKTPRKNRTSVQQQAPLSRRNRARSAEFQTRLLRDEG